MAINSPPERKAGFRAWMAFVAMVWIAMLVVIIHFVVKFW